MGRSTEVTVVIATRDRWPLLSAHALPSALGQERVALEVVVVDDGSTDETAARLAELDDPRVRVLRHETSRGVAIARNAGIAAARGSCIAFLDDDDLWSPSKLRRQLDSLGGGGWGFASTIVVDETISPLYALPLPDGGDVAAGLMLGNIVPGGTSNVIARTELVRRLGAFDETLSHSADWDLWIRLARSGQPAVCDEVLVATLQHPQRMMFRDQPDLMGEAERLFEKHGQATRRQMLTVAEWIAEDHHREGRRRRAAALYLRAAVRYRSPGNVPPAVGALFGEAGMRLASRLLHRLRGQSHLDHDTSHAVTEPPWLERHRARGRQPGA